VVGYVQRLWGIHIDMVRNRGSKGMDRYPLTVGPKQNPIYGSDSPLD
jgi:hypothetical protein